MLSVPGRSLRKHSRRCRASHKHACLCVRARVCFPGEQLSGPWAAMTAGVPLPSRRSSLLTEGGGKPDSTRGGRLASGEPAQRRLNGGSSLASPPSHDSLEAGAGWRRSSGMSHGFFTCSLNIFVCVPAESGLRIKTH